MSATPRRTVHRPALIVLAVVLAVAAVALGWWQWERFSSASGTAQNLGYAMQWPLFGAFALFAYFRFVRLEREATDDGNPAAAGESAGSGPAAEDSRATDAVARADRRGAGGAGGRRRVAAREPREIPAGFLPERPRAARDTDPVLAEYNSYLARLNAGDQAGSEARDSERSAG
ncbi:transcriptional regulator [Nocardia carnea]|uniref:transcriptional regulator n=1 Tax=Nocardia carnea TaxID=37328 RepID=UPI00245545BD|nr:transcriptional regulator [Nocardia carnea]